MKAEDSAYLKRLGKQILVVTVSAKIAMPPDFEHIVDVIGQIDGFGATDSCLDLGTEVKVPFALASHEHRAADASAGDQEHLREST